MIQIVLASHGKFCIGLKQTAEMINGKIDNLSVESFKPGQDVSEYKRNFEKDLKDTSIKPTLIFVDIKGGTPYNTAMMLSKNHNLKVITGINLPILLSVIIDRQNNTSIDDLVSIALNNTNWGIEESRLGGKYHAKLSINKN